MFGCALNWEVYGSHGETKSRDFGQDLNAQNFINATNVALVNGQIVCTTAQTRPAVSPLQVEPPIADPNCVPLNVFGEQRASQAARDYVIEEFVTVSEQRQTVFQANLGGALFDLWAGPVGFNIGYEHRKEFASFTPSDFQQAGRGRSVPITALAVLDTLNEVFGELSIPLVSEENNVPFIHSASVIGRGRYSDNTVNGGFFSYTVGGNLAPIEDVEFRGNFTKSFRSPAITELFLPTVNTFAFVPDLCQPSARRWPGAGDPCSQLRGVHRSVSGNNSSNSPDPASTASVPAQSAVTWNLRNEQANSYSFGVILRPRFIPRLSITADYVDITLKDPIANLTIAQIASGCFDNADFDASDPANGNSFCLQINYGPNGRGARRSAESSSGQRFRQRQPDQVQRYSGRDRL